MQSQQAPTFAIVSAVYGVEAYLPDFIASVEAQTISDDDLEIIAVDDGSIDGSAEILARWSQESRFKVTVVRKENGGQASARNVGIELVTAPWVSFADPDDMLEQDYFRNVKKFLSKNPDVDLIATGLVYYEERDRLLRDGHPRRWMFRGGDQAVDIESFPDYNQASAGSSLVRTHRLIEHGLRFPTHIRPIFEDAYFFSQYLLRYTRPVIGIVASAQYRYRRRDDGSSTLQRSQGDERRYTIIPRDGYLHLLKTAKEMHGYVPRWLQGLILYDLSWYFAAEHNAKSTVPPCSPEIGKKFVDTVREIAGYLEPERVLSYTRRPFRSEVRDFLAYAAREDNWRSPYAVLDRLDEESRTLRLRFRFAGNDPQIEILVRGTPSRYTISKVRHFSYFGQAILKELIAFVPADGTLRVICDGREVELRTQWSGPTTTALRPAQIRARLGGHAPREPLAKLSTRLLRRMSSNRLVRWHYRNAWVLMDRIHNAGDNAERFFEYLRREHPRQRTYFVIDTRTPTGKALRRRFRGRIVHYGSFRWKLLMLNCAHLISSHADVPVIRPRAITRLGRPRWKTTFLQHGVTKDDISRWLNDKPIDLFVTSTHAEANSLRGDGSPYTFTPVEVRVLGMPRFDRLLKLSKKNQSKKKQILVMPTWRDSLSGKDLADSQDKGLIENITETEYFHAWSRFLRAPQLMSLAQSGWTIVFHPHSNMTSIIDYMQLGHHVTVLRHGERDIQELIAESQIMITDYSSVAFDAAFSGTDIVYYQFDHAEFWSGAHNWRRGYFDYVRDGFGPVAFSHEDAISFLTSVANSGADSIYKERANAALVLDSHNCERVYEAIKDLDRHYSKKRRWEISEADGSGMETAKEMHGG